LKLRDNKEISRKAIINEAKRRDFLSPEYDADKDQEEIDKEAPADPTPQDLRDALPPTPGGPQPPPQQHHSYSWRLTVAWLDTRYHLAPVAARRRRVLAGYPLWLRCWPLRDGWL
jgi:hypothetical protein